LELIKSPGKQFTDLALELLPKNAIQMLSVADLWDADAIEKAPSSGWLKNAAVEAGLVAVMKSSRAYLYLERIAPILTSQGGRLIISYRVDGRRTRAGAAIRRLSRRERSQHDVKLTGAGWNYLHLIEEFCNKPNKSALASVFLAISKDGDITNAAFLTSTFVPWPIRTLLALARRDQNPPELAAQISNGQFGDQEDWVLAEERWVKKGLQFSDLEYAANTGQFFDRSVAAIGIPSGLGAANGPSRGRPQKQTFS
jgi:hypothetical protein